MTEPRQENTETHKKSTDSLRNHSPTPSPLARWGAGTLGRWDEILSEVRDKADDLRRLNRDLMVSSSVWGGAGRPVSSRRTSRSTKTATKSWTGAASNLRYASCTSGLGRQVRSPRRHCWRQPWRHCGPREASPLVRRRLRMVRLCSRRSVRTPSPDLADHGGKGIPRHARRPAVMLDSDGCRRVRVRVASFGVPLGGAGRKADVWCLQLVCVDELSDESRASVTIARPLSRWYVVLNHWGIMSESPSFRWSVCSSPEGLQFAGGLSTTGRFRPEAPCGRRR